MSACMNAKEGTDELPIDGFDWIALKLTFSRSDRSEKVKFCYILLLLMGTTFHNYLADVTLPDSNQIREECRCAICSSFSP